MDELIAAHLAFTRAEIYQYICLFIYFFFHVANCKWHFSLPNWKGFLIQISGCAQQFPAKKIPKGKDTPSLRRDFRDAHPFATGAWKPLYGVGGSSEGVS